jgi:hypothetical protein
MKAKLCVEKRHTDISADSRGECSQILLARANEDQRLHPT